LQVDFTALSFAAPQKVQFRYRLEGFDTDWVDAGGRRQAFYTNLPPANYRFQVVAGHDGAWGEGGAVWAFSVRPAYYQTTWFLVVVAAIAVMLVFGAFQYRARRARDRFRMVLAERVRVSREIHDTLLQDLIGVTLQFDALEAELGAATTARMKFESLRRQLRQSIRAARQSIRDLRTPMPKLDLAAALRKIIKETVPAQSNVTAHVDVIGGVRQLPAKQEEELLRIAQEAVINAVRHAQATRVRVELRYEPAVVRLNIIDNGRGFDPKVAEFNAHDHWGLASMQERAEQSSAEFRLSTKPGEGTVIQISVAAPVIVEEVPS
jgi:signal transduction histidine kinase